MGERWRISAEVAGGLGPQTVMDRSVHPPRVEVLHYVFEDWLGDDIVETFPCYLVTRRLADALIDAGLVGLVFDRAKVSRSEECMAMNPDLILPEFVWLRLVEDESCDLSSRGGKLVVSRRALDVLKRFVLRQAEVTRV